MVPADAVERDDMEILDVLSPCGATAASRSHAPRLSGLRGKTVCELSNGLWESHRIFPLIRELLHKQVPDVTVVPYDEFPVGSRAIDVDDIAQAVVARGCQAVIGGNAG
ncbi:MAG: hypothetical protein HYY32_00715 [Chloroflexi bacterium]|nr:hypothetical protein [Chloroflexota bacterium]